MGLAQRAAAKPGEIPADMKELYAFWGDCLLNSFNVRMYNEFKSYALEDARAEVPSTFGLRKLLHFYRGVLGQDRQPAWRVGKPYPSVMAQDHVDAQKLSESLDMVPNGEARV